jgi:type I restriction enzyme R subunit
MDKKTRRRRYEELDDRFEYTANELDRAVTAPNQIRTVLELYRDRLPTELFPGRAEVPKTLIFAKDDNHAEAITAIAREVFGRGNDFCKKITYQTMEDPKALLKSFRIEPLPRIVVTVDMIATGTDAKPIEVLIFMRDVKSEIYFEQMKGRGVRSIRTDDLLQVTPDAKAGKERFLIIDAVGVTESCKTTMRPMERLHGVPFAKLIDHVAAGDRRDETLISLAGRLTALDGRIEAADRAQIAELSGGHDLHTLAEALMAATDPDAIEQAVATAHGSLASGGQREAIEREMKDAAARPFDNPALRQLVKELKQRAEMLIDEISTDAVIGADFDIRKAEETTGRFTRFIEENKDTLVALQVLYGQPVAARRLAYADLQDLAAALTRPPWVLDTALVWEAYRRLDAAKVRGRPMLNVLTELVALVRYALGQTETLESFSAGV